jgi:hypothetical protein
VLGNGSAFGSDVPPGPGEGAGDACGEGEGCCVCDTNWIANESSRQKHAATRTIEFIFTSKDANEIPFDESRDILLQAFVGVQSITHLPPASASREIRMGIN